MHIGIPYTCNIRVPKISGMKKILIVLSVVVGLFLILLFMLPLFFRGDIARIIEKQSAKYLNAELEIESIGLSMFKSFPNLNVSVKNVILTGKGEFEGDTVAVVPLFTASVDVVSLLGGKEIDIPKIFLKDARLALEINARGKNNWDVFIQKKTDAVPTEKLPEDSGKKSKEQVLLLHDIVVENLSLNYQDQPASAALSVDRMDLELSGNLGAAHTFLAVDLKMEELSFRQKNNIWISPTNVRWQAEIDAAPQTGIFEIRKNKLLLNDLQLELAGKAARQKGKIGLDLRLKTPDTRFESLLALVPKNYRTYMQGLQTTGSFTFDLSVRGEYYQNHLPAFALNFTIENGSIQYPELPEKIEKIDMVLNVENPGGSIDSTSIDLQRLSFDLARNPFEIYLQITGIDDPVLNGGAQGKIDLSKLQKALPLKNVTLKGEITTDLTFKGKYRYIEEQEYEKFTAGGKLSFRNISYADAQFPEGIRIPSGEVTVSPARLNLDNLKVQFEASDVTFRGYVTGYLPYILKNETLKGNFTLSSNYLDLNEFIRSGHSSGGTGTQSDGSATVTEAPIIPANLDLQLDTRFRTVVLDKLEIREIKGSIGLARSIASLNKVNMYLLNGSLTIDGQYKAEKYKFPHFDFHLNAMDFDLQEAYRSFAFIRKNLPIAQNCKGKISSRLQLSSDLSMDLALRTNTLNGEGFIASQGILIEGNPSVLKLADIVKNDELSRLSISSLRIDFRIQNGNITVAPFTTKLAGNPATIYGSQTAEGKIDYTLSLNVDRKFFGKDMENLLSAIPGSGNIQNLDVDARITGTLNHPEVKADLSKAINKVRKAAEKDLKKKALKGLEKLFK